LVKRLSDIRDKFWNEERRAKAASMGINPVGIATVASIVEEETAKKDERPKVARLYLNRLKRGMLLQADPTVKFAIGDFGLRRIYNTHLTVDSPYNTYKYKGLPPGPIRIPERSTLEAVLDAPAHNYIYMCAKEDFSGYHNFATDIAEHNRNAARYHRALSQRNIR
ncbi:MAG: endolytic transglycosylase MltG, partial [Muribaculaceae bacterium]|nr:endolytic transglycosylase MltG [Muribaculaceae bacterium]